ncbi:hypothetical protein [Halobacillus mangrovi]|uniref:Uncharacterized protein n=1 Tax=Halobacillus mangrovi TaxID=402384 RepID=A0A1W5ZX09_9BACI|nr:hypothetical protein [Halobacillus mangrovi]ARI77810.1 hypothetical protein HM131_13550 [Halobacillus mangrovi]
MFTYDSFVTDGAFTLMRPVFVLLLCIMLALFFIILFPRLRRRFTNGLSVVGLSVVSLAVSCQLLYYSGIIVDEFGLGGDEISTYLFLLIAAFASLNSFIYFVLKSENFPKRTMPANKGNI